MSWMSELLASYNECKISFMSSHHRKGKAPAKSSSSSTFTLADLKSKHEIWNFMLCDLIPTGPLSQPNTTESQKKLAIASWAIMVLVALCHEPNAGKEPSDVVTSARSFVLSGLARAIQDAIISEEPVDTRYGRLYALSDLTFRLLTATPFAQRPSASPSEAPIQIAKIMLEKNYAALLSNALADVDLNFPSVQRLSNSILRPLEHLTKAVTKISRASTNRKTGNNTTGPASTIEVESVPPTKSSVEDEEMMPTEEDAPDLYRNSALGLYEGELEPGNRDNSPSTSEEQDHFDDDDADMDDLDDGAMLGGSDLSDASDEDGDITIDMGEPDSDTSDGDHEGKDDDDDDDDDDPDDDDDEDDDDGDDDDVDDHHEDKDDTDLDMGIVNRGGGNAIVMPQSLDNPSDLDEEARNLMNFLNSGAPDLGLPKGNDQLINAGGGRGEIEDHMDDEDGGSAGDQGHVVDDGFEGGSLDSGDEVVIETGIGDNRTEAAPWSWNGVLPFQPRAKIQAAPVDLGGHPTLLHQATDNVFGRPRTVDLPAVKVSVALIVGWTFDLDPLTSGSLRSKTFSEAELVLLASRCLANLMEALPGSAHTVVHHGAVPVLCANLLEINFSDLAEQSLSTLEKISEELLSSIVCEGGLTALLQYLVCLSTYVQRTAVTAAANCCSSILSESFDMVRDVFPDLVQYSPVL
ncbi:hypothetical protein MJO29_011278 [Puccinia striiformis f. sp. tritici]|nr:hypothetical protein MJO29_011278 [Puccinia striiformis f. sp. tritici]